MAAGIHKAARAGISGNGPPDEHAVTALLAMFKSASLADALSNEQFAANWNTALQAGGFSMEQLAADNKAPLHLAMVDWVVRFLVAVRGESLQTAIGRQLTRPADAGLREVIELWKTMYPLK